MKTTLDYWLSAMAGFKLLDMVQAPRRRADILRWIKRDLNAAQRSSKSPRFQAKCADLLEVVRLELLELVELEPQQAVAA